MESKKTLRYPSFVFELSTFSAADQSIARYEIMTWWNMDMVDEWASISENREQCIIYLKRRVAETSNPILRYRYNLFLFALAKDNRYANQCIDAILEIMPSILVDDDEDNLFSANADRAIADLIKLAGKIKDKQDEAKVALWKIVDSSSGYKMKLEILGQAMDASFFGASDATKIVSVCKSLFPMTTDGWRERCCEIGLHYAAKMGKEGHLFTAFFSESLGDLEMAELVDIDNDQNNILLPHYNHLHLAIAIRFYKLAHADAKLLDAQKQYREVGPKLRYIRLYESKPVNKDVVAYYNRLKLLLLESRPTVLVFSFVMLDSFLLPSSGLLRKWAEQRVQKDDPPQFSPARVDINNNTHEEDPLEHEMLFFYDMWVKNIMRQSIMDVLLSAIASGQLSYGKLRAQLLKHSTFSAPVAYTRGEEKFSCSWFDQIDFALKDLFRQYKRAIAGKPTDWRIPIDVLPAKFEGMLRDIVDTEGGQSTKVGRNQELQAALLDDLVRDPVLKRVFSDEDILFFEYVFTSKGENIRNNVAHGFFKPCDYNIYRATLVFLCILRLAKYAPK